MQVQDADGGQSLSHASLLGCCRFQEGWLMKHSIERKTPITQLQADSQSLSLATRIQTAKDITQFNCKQTSGFSGRSSSSEGAASAASYQYLVVGQR